MPSDITQARHILSRRDFLRRFAASAGIILIGFESIGTLVYDKLAPMTLILNKSAFASRVNDAFSVNLGRAGNHIFKLLQVSDEVSKTYYQPGQIESAPTDACFALVFHGPRNDSITQGTYRFTHADLGTFLLFIVPGSADENGQRFVAVVNHLTPMPASRI